MQCTPLLFDWRGQHVAGCERETRAIELQGERPLPVHVIDDAMIAAQRNLDALASNLQRE